MLDVTVSSICSLNARNMKHNDMLKFLPTNDNLICSLQYLNFNLTCNSTFNVTFVSLTLEGIKFLPLICWDLNYLNLRNSLSIVIHVVHISIRCDIKNLFIRFIKVIRKLYPFYFIFFFIFFFLYTSQSVSSVLCFIFSYNLF